MKRVLFFLFVAIFALSTSAQRGNRDSGNNTSATPLQVSVSGNISADNFVKGTVGTVTFNRFPANVNEWKQVREQIGETMPGAVALQIMACELYRRNNNAGAECIKLNTVSNQVKSYTGLVKDLFRRSRPYQYAAYLKDASWDNGYNPTKPYVITVEVGATSNVEYSNSYQTNIYGLFVKSNGHEMHDGWQPVSVMVTAKPGEPGEGKYYIIFASSSIFLQCKEKSFTAAFNGLD